MSLLEPERDGDGDPEEDLTYVPCVPVSNLYDILASSEPTTGHVYCLNCDCRDVCQEEPREKECCDCGSSNVRLFYCKECYKYSCMDCM